MLALAILLTAHNRQPQTLACLEAFFKQTNLPKELQTQVFLVDDGSTDGTADAIRKFFPSIHLLQGNGNLYWNGGMRLAFDSALRKDFDHYLWLNDDTLLFPDALSRLLTTSTQFDHQAIVVASTQDPKSGALTYGGVKRLQRWKPLKFSQILPAKEPIPVETMNGNCVLVPRIVAQKVGNLDPAFTHGIGDYDYGLRAQRAGFKIYLAPGYYGLCQRNIIQHTKKMRWQMRWQVLVSYKGLPPKEWGIFAKRYAGPFWPIFWISPYLRNLFFSK